MFNDESSERKRNRLKNYDYSQNGSYFITICVKNRIEYFGEIKNCKMILNAYGEIVKQRWLWLGNQYDYVKLDEYIVMPNHIHGIVVIDNKNVINNPRRDNPRIIPTLIIPTTIYNRRHNLLSKTINAFKTTSSKLIHQNGLDNFSWQMSFYDHITRSNEELNRIRAYILNNPLKWNVDRNNVQNLCM